MVYSSAQLVEGRRPPAIRRCWLFLPGADRRSLASASASGADVLIQELEDLTPPERRPEARALAGEIFSAWRAAGIVAAGPGSAVQRGRRAEVSPGTEGRARTVFFFEGPAPSLGAGCEYEKRELAHGSTLY